MTMWVLFQNILVLFLKHSTITDDAKPTLYKMGHEAYLLVHKNPCRTVFLDFYFVLFVIVLYFLMMCVHISQFHTVTMNKHTHSRVVFNLLLVHALL